MKFSAKSPLVIISNLLAPSRVHMETLMGDILLKPILAAKAGVRKTL